VFTPLAKPKESPDGSKLLSRAWGAAKKGEDGTGNRPKGGLLKYARLDAPASPPAPHPPPPPPLPCPPRRFSKAIVKGKKQEKLIAGASAAAGMFGSGAGVDLDESKMNRKLENRKKPKMGLSSKKLRPKLFRK
jgi:hypothetical protein